MTHGLTAGMIRPTYTHTKARVFSGANVAIDALESVMPTGRPAGPHAQPTERDIQIVNHHQHVLWIDLVPVQDLANGFSTLIHIGLWLHHHHSKVFVAHLTDFSLKPTAR